MLSYYNVGFITNYYRYAYGILVLYVACKTQENNVATTLPPRSIHYHTYMACTYHKLLKFCWYSFVIYSTHFLPQKLNNLRCMPLTRFVSYDEHMHLLCDDPVQVYISLHMYMLLDPWPDTKKVLH